MRTSHPMSGAMGLDINLDSLLSAAKTNILGQVATDPAVQAAGLQAGQQAAAQTLADKIIANKNFIIYGAVALVGLLAYIAFKRK